MFPISHTTNRRFSSVGRSPQTGRSIENNGPPGAVVVARPSSRRETHTHKKLTNKPVENFTRLFSAALFAVEAEISLPKLLLSVVCAGVSFYLKWFYHQYVSVCVYVLSAYVRDGENFCKTSAIRRRSLLLLVHLRQTF